MAVRVGIFPSDCWLTLSQELETEKLLFYVYLWTNNHRHISGAYKLPLMYCVADIFCFSKGDPNIINETLQSLEGAGLIVWDAHHQEVFVRDYMACQSQLQEKKDKEPRKIPESTIKGLANNINNIKSQKIKMAWLEEISQNSTIKSELQRHGYESWLETISTPVEHLQSTCKTPSKDLSNGSGNGLGFGSENGFGDGMSIGHPFVCTKGDPPA